MLVDVFVVVEERVGGNSSRLSLGGGGDFRLSLGGLLGAERLSDELDMANVEGAAKDDGEILDCCCDYL